MLKRFWLKNLTVLIEGDFLEISGRPTARPWQVGGLFHGAMAASWGARGSLEAPEIAHGGSREFNRTHGVASEAPLGAQEVPWAAGGAVPPRPRPNICSQNSNASQAFEFWAATPTMRDL